VPIRGVRRINGWATRRRSRIEVELACLSAAALRGPPPDRALLFVNIGHRVMLDPRFDDVRAALPPHVLEITEHEPVEDYPQLLARLKPWISDGTLAGDRRRRLGLLLDGARAAALAGVREDRPHLDRRNPPQPSAAVAGVRAGGVHPGIHATSIAEGTSMTC